MKTAIQLVASDILDIKTLNIDEVQEIVKILALRMDDEKQNIIDSYNNAIAKERGIKASKTKGEQYYNETFKH